jgi:membrane-associated protease RseP (regulator of RpoE activity)
LQREPNLGYLQDEVNALNSLNELGIPTVKNYGIIDVGGQPGLLLERVPGAISSKSITEGNGLLPGANISNLNQQSISDLQNIRSLLVERNVNVTDLQFLISNKGRVVINDPMGIGAPHSRSDLNLIDELIAASRNRGN